ncbi:hypothetical protein BT96DRAFT_980861 [Gymnopus androsaceus JB14]|uniref:Uncharacterized protein n=1 Tax=Gymnopus androsaceus JB14 TaxID=1447944 RepID=A0A6A4GT58_9AGAR|nr:hypothetical protein BT96DRAFT_980861 [Gymnopus androsaceus JB14]
MTGSATNLDTDSTTSTTSASQNSNSGSTAPFDSQSQYTGSVAAPRKEILTFVLPDEEGDDDRHALVPLPKTYDEAVACAIRVLGTYMGDATPSNIRLRSRIQDVQRKWIWADIDPENWQLLVSSGDNVGVFEKIRVPRGIHHFMHGEVFLSFGKKETQNRLVWSNVTQPANPPGRGLTYTLVGRPSKLIDAIQIIRALPMTSNVPYEWTEARKQVKDWTEEDWAEATSKIKFYKFVNPNLSTAVYQELPPIAYTNDDVWRVLVPMPGEVLGVVLPPKSEVLPFKSEY